MRIFISWSGDPARRLAEAFQVFFRTVLGGHAHTFVSSQDIGKGARGGSVLAQELGTTDTGLLILTSRNQDAPWVLFEAGALSKSLDASRVIPLLVDLEQAKPTSPLAQFQHVKLSDEEDVLRLVEELNASTPQPLPAETVRILFAAQWPVLRAEVDAALTALGEPEAQESEASLLGTILDEVRGVADQSRRLTTRVAALESYTGPIRVSGTGSKDDPVRLAGVEALRRKITEPTDTISRSLARQLVQNIREANTLNGARVEVRVGGERVVLDSEDLESDTDEAALQEAEKRAADPEA